MNIILNHISHTYDNDTTREICALDDVSFNVTEGEFIAVIGKTGSGKSTLVNVLNGLIKADKGEYYFNGEDVYQKGYSLRQLRMKIGLVQQYPENQLFEEDVITDVCFAPLNQGHTKEEALDLAYEALDLVGFPEGDYSTSPLELSGGRKRMAAIAGILAMKPEVIILDEPAAGLDPATKREIFELLVRLNTEKGITVIFVTHDMEDAYEYADRVVVMDAGKKVLDGEVAEVFSKESGIERYGLRLPLEVRIIC